MTFSSKRTASLAIILAFAAAGCASHEDGPQAPAATPEKSPNDDWSYRYMVLDNGLRVLLATDPDADKAAASLVVFRGSFHEPADRPGLAHFLEHMLFIATEKYPETDGYQAFLSANGGNANAYTAADHTNYFFDVGPAFFREAMDRFAQFFIAPSLDPAYVERERNAVHSEYQLQMKDDGWRTFAANKMALNPDHPGARFNIGSLGTLGDGTHQALKRFFQQHYSADQMALVALSNQGLDEMAAWIAPMFNAIPNRRLGPAPISTPPFRMNGLPATLSIQPQKEIRSVTYRFPVPSTRPHYRAKPQAYITNLLGHEGRGSLHAALKAKGWIESLSASSASFDDAHDFLEVSIRLTRLGAEQINGVGGALFTYIDLLRSATAEAWRYQEQAQVADLGFRFKEPHTALGFVYRMGPNLAHIPPRDLLREPYLMADFDPPLIAEYLSYLHRDNVLVEVVAPEAPSDAIEPWFKVPYALKRGAIALADTEVELHLPTANPFIPQNLALLEDDLQPAKRIPTLQGAQIWVDSDLEFGAPRANLYLLLSVPGGLHSLADQAAAHLHRKLALDQLNAYAYPAKLAGLSYDIGVAPEGYSIRIGGYTGRQHLLLKAVLEALANTGIEPDNFARQRAELARSWRNFAAERPYTQTIATLGQALVRSRWPRVLLAEAAERLDPETLQSWRDRRLGKLGLIALLHGNVDAGTAGRVAAAVHEKLPLAPVAATKPPLVQVDGNYRLPVTIGHDDASVVLYVQDESASIEARAHSALAVQLMEQAFFTELRTEQQLGYVVAATNASFQGHGGVGFIVQSPVASPAEIEQAVLAFVDARVPVLKNLPDEAFVSYKAGLVNELREQDQNLRIRTDRMWHDLDLGFTGFDYNRQLAERVSRLDKPAMLAFLRQLQDKVRSKRLIVYNLGKFTEPPANGQMVEDATWFKAPAPVETAAGSPAAPGRSAW